MSVDLVVVLLALLGNHPTGVSTQELAAASGASADEVLAALAKPVEAGQVHFGSQSGQWYALKQGAEL